MSEHWCDEQQSLQSTVPAESFAGSASSRLAPDPVGQESGANPERFRHCRADVVQPSQTLTTGELTGMGREPLEGEP